MSPIPAGDPLFPERFVPEEMHGVIEAEHIARYRWASGCVAGRRVLDAGCGVGYGSLLLRAAGAASVTGVDVAQEAVEAAARRAGDVAQFQVADITSLPFEDASFDVVVCVETIEHVSHPDDALDELRRVLTRDGLLIVSSPNRNVYEEGNPHHVCEYTPDELQTALNERLANVRLDRQQAWLVSIICDDKMLVQDDPDRVLDIEVRKLEALRPGQETFAVALASDAELPAPGALAMLTDAGELAAWRERARSAESHLSESHAAAEETRSTYKSMTDDYGDALAALERCQRTSTQREETLNRLSTLLAERNAALRLATHELGELRGRASELRKQLDQSAASLASVRRSRIWRLTAPLRAFGRGRRAT